MVTKVEKSVVGPMADCRERRILAIVALVIPPCILMVSVMMAMGWMPAAPYGFPAVRLAMNSGPQEVMRKFVKAVVCVTLVM